MSHHNTKKSSKPRVAIYSQRHLQRLLSRCVAYEFEDVIFETDNAEFIVPEPRSYFPTSRKYVNRLANYFSLAGNLNPGVKKGKLHQDYDLFLAICMFPNDLLTLNSLPGWKNRCQTSVCVLEEIWAAELDRWPGQLKILSQFDYVILNCSVSVEPLKRIIQRPCIYKPPGVDAIRFCPLPHSPPRSIDVFNLGRRSDVTHQAFLDMVEKKGIFYVYDTMTPKRTLLPKEHRQLVANMAKRSRYFLANTAKINLQKETRGQSEVGFRFFEGAAAGTVMIGNPPDNENFRTYFDWPDAVIPVNFDEPNISDVLDDLDSQQERLNSVSIRSVYESLRKHDWAYRWEDILEMVGMQPLQPLLERKKQLMDLATIAENSLGKDKKTK